MSIVTVQLGQCGNQIGGQLFSSIIEDLAGDSKACLKSHKVQYNETALERFFNVSDVPGKTLPEARAVMVDMEQKVIAQTLQNAKQSGKWCYPSKQQFCQKRGSGNNWAHGYCLHGPQTQSAVMEMVRREVEKCDHFGGFLTLLSLAGGTGSGVGTYINQRLRDEYPECFILNQVVWPYNTGEVIVQNYNAVLTLSHLYQSSDAVLVMENDHLQKVCSQLLGLKNISFVDLNRVVSHHLTSVLMPAYSGMTTWDTPVSAHLGEMLTHLVAHPQYKLLTVRNIPTMSERSKQYSAYQWHGLLKHLRQMLIANAHMEEGIDWQIKGTASSYGFNCSLSNLLMLRGQDIPTADISAFSERQLYPPWMPSDGAFKAWSQPRPLSQYEKSAVLISNSQSPVDPLDQIIGKAWNMFASRAYVHQYLKHGLVEEDFVDSFACLEQVVASYRSLS